MEWKMPKGVFFTCQEPGGQHPEVWVPMESPKGLAMEGSSVIQRKKKRTYQLKGELVLPARMY